MLYLQMLRKKLKIETAFYLSVLASIVSIHADSNVINARKKTDDNTCDVYCNGKKLSSLGGAIISENGGVSVSIGGHSIKVVSLKGYASGNHMEIHFHLPNGQALPEEEELIAQFTNMFSVIINGLLSTHMIRTTPAENSLAGLFGANFTARNNIIIINIYFDGLVGAAGLSSANAVPTQAENGILRVQVADGAGSPVSVAFSANFIADNNVLTTHIHLPSEVRTGLQEILKMFGGLLQFVPKVLPVAMPFISPLLQEVLTRINTPITFEVANQNETIQLDLTNGFNLIPNQVPQELLIQEPDEEESVLTGQEVPMGMTLPRQPEVITLVSDYEPA